MGARTKASENIRYAPYDEMVLDAYAVTYYMEGTRDRDIVEAAWLGNSRRDIAREWGLCNERVNQIVRRAIAKTRHHRKAADDARRAEKAAVDAKIARSQLMKSKMQERAVELGYTPRTGTTAAHVAQRGGAHDVSEITRRPLKSYETLRGAGKNAMAVLGSYYEEA